HRVVAAVASLDEVRRWRRMAVLLEVAAVTPQWAEALVKGGVLTLVDLSHLGLAELETLFTAARTARTIPDVPTHDQMAAMLADAARLTFAGAITGTVRDRSGRPVADATVTAGAASATTDARGRFRLRRLLLGRDVSVSISKASYRTSVTR